MSSFVKNFKINKNPIYKIKHKIANTVAEIMVIGLRIYKGKNDKEATRILIK